MPAPLFHNLYESRVLVESQDIIEETSCWVFGYGSLIWRPGFPFVRREEGWISGWSRRFWQGSPDHRGTPENPGRVVTLIPDPGSRCWGVAYELPAAERDEIMNALDIREQAGYERILTTVHLRDGESSLEDVLMYVAREENPCFLGPCALEELARWVRSCEGPSGSNEDYVRTLAAALREMGAEDLEVFMLADKLT